MYTASEKLAIIRLVEESELSIRRTLDEIRVSRSSFYRWYQAYERGGLEGLENASRASHQHWNVDLHPKLIHYPRIFASNFDPCSCRQAPSLLYQAGLAITASPGSNLNANQHKYRQKYRQIGGISLD